MISKTLITSALFATGASFAYACSSNSPSGFGASSGADNDSGILGPNLLDGDSHGPCTGLECARPNCPGGGDTTLTGKVFAPNGKDPLYNVLVYVPNAKVEPFVDGVACETCAASVSGKPITSALTDTSGAFELKGMPAGKDIPLVIQVGRWRRQITISNVGECTETKVADGTAHLPKNQSEGDIPQMAIVTSTYDPTECILKEIGLDSAEFTSDTGSGRVHIFHGNGNNLSPSAPSGASLWTTAATLEKYQLVAFPCASYPTNAVDSKNVFDYANKGGRVFITDLSYPIISNGTAPWPSTGNWASPGGFTNPATIDTTFPKGQALAEWLQKLGATPSAGQITLAETYSRVGAIAAPAQKWLYSGSNTQAYTFNTPLDAAEKDQCGRVYYSSFHIGSGRSSTSTFPGACQTKPLTAQERVLEFMLFDLASCVLSDKEKPTVPK